MSKPAKKLDRGNKLWDGHRMVTAVSLGEGYYKIKEDMNLDRSFALEKEGQWLLPERQAVELELILMDMDAEMFRYFIVTHRNTFPRELREAVAEASIEQIMEEMVRLRDTIC